MEESSMRFTSILAVILALVGVGAGGAGLYYAFEARDSVNRLESHIVDVEKQLGAFPDELHKLDNRVHDIAQGAENAVNGIRSDVAAVRDQVTTLTNRPPPPPTPPPLPTALEVGAAPAPGPAGPGGTYVIKAGDTFGKIAKSQHTTIAALTKANPGVDASKLAVGQKIHLP